jgi:hypothetical protein
MKSAKQPNQKDDRKRDSDQPQQKTAAHGFLLFSFAINTIASAERTADGKVPSLRWELINFSPIPLGHPAKRGG